MMPVSHQEDQCLEASAGKEDQAIPLALGPIPNSSANQLIAAFAKDFSFVLAMSEEDKKKAYKLRHDVFIKELGYHMSTVGGKPLEADEYDATAAQCILVHKKTGQTAGCFRIVSPYSRDGRGPRKLPVEEHGQEGISHDTLHPEMMPRDKICEASRLAISWQFRHQLKESAEEAANAMAKECPAIRLILPSLFLAAYSLAELLGNRHLYAMMAPTLPRLLKKSGFNFIKLGDTIEFHGRRNVFYINRDLADSGMQHDFAPLHKHIYQQLMPQVAQYLSDRRMDSA